MTDTTLITNKPEMASAFHEGEQFIQQKVGKKNIMDAVGKKFIRSFLLEQHCEFYQGLQYVFIGHLDAQLQPWASILFKKTGLIKVISPTQLHIDISETDTKTHEYFSKGDQVGLLGIELSNKRRNRLTGVVLDISADCIKIQVKQSFGNCPKYITPRVIADWPASNQATHNKETHSQALHNQDVQKTEAFNNKMLDLLKRADSFFVASYYQNSLAKNQHVSEGADVSYRGGEPGFIEIINNKQIIIPDYVGNNFFNTLGNIEKSGKAGLLFINFDNGDTLSMSGKAKILWDLEPTKQISKSNKAQRYWQFTLEQAYLKPHHLPLKFEKV
ncbi:pyridoxamine 5'-phosphate oxidase family protein [Paraglaciecola aquimarina]|uniref:Pyridoxamine 5'-phosphate oxidase family protein n=1 Tax=Paraglaciecola algarum TaxID=3050085 RepID=A0ABS9D9J1_9ALTE|nr:pyridoxamine 5'-phosphate oxidase family protein [Paraglaciecola sp. G1-23]MCF2949399.1 pyridoxamine 5'-phosphate oxidase family protein [Paraglaciecola sp. G1-23]